MAYPDIEQPLKEVGPVVRGNLFKQRQVEQQQRMETAKQSPVADNAQMLVDAARINKPASTTPVQTPQPVAKPTYSIPNVNPQSPTDGMDLLSSMYTSPEQEEKYRKAALANQRITAVADALRHIGNIYNTVNYAPAQQLNNATQVEADRYLKGKALRDAANMRYLSYQQQKANQEARIRQAEAQLRYNMAKDARDYELRKNESDARANYNNARILNQNTIAALNQLKAEGIISDNEFKRERARLYPQEMQSKIDKNNRTGGGRSSGGSRGGSSKPTQWQTRYADYDYANQNGIPVMDETTDILGNKTTKRRDPNVVHAEVEEHKRKNAGKGSGSSSSSNGSSKAKGGKTNNSGFFNR